MNPLDAVKVHYHSPRWMELVEQGWTTHVVETDAGGTRWATMVWARQPARRPY